MGAFTTTKILYGDKSMIPYITENIRMAFVSEGYEVMITNPSIGDELYISKGGILKSALGLRSALKITMKSTDDGYIKFKAGVSIFKQQAIPTLITVCLCSPVVVTQIWGMIKQSKLDEKALEVAEYALYKKS